MNIDEDLFDEKDLEDVWLFPRDGYDYAQHLREGGGGVAIEVPGGPIPDPSVTTVDSVLMYSTSRDDRREIDPEVLRMLKEENDDDEISSLSEGDIQIQAELGVQLKKLKPAREGEGDLQDDFFAIARGGDINQLKPLAFITGPDGVNLDPFKKKRRRNRHPTDPQPSHSYTDEEMAAMRAKLASMTDEELLARMGGHIDEFEEFSSDFDDDDEMGMDGEELDHQHSLNTEGEQDKDALDQKLQKMMAEQYDDDEIGALEGREDETKGTKTLEDFEAIFDEYEKGKRIIRGETTKAAPIDLPDVKPIVVYSDLTETEKSIITSFDEQERLKEAEEEEKRKESGEGEDEEIEFVVGRVRKGKGGLEMEERKPRDDIMSIRTTSTTTMNHPSLITRTNHKTRLGLVAEREDEREKDKQARFPKRKTEKEDDDSEEEEESEEEGKEVTGARPRNETKEERKLRKQAVKQARREARANKKNLKNEFKQEEKRIKRELSSGKQTGFPIF
ncbi:putative protein LTV1 [Blattamonas nauphoetae]|uniref:Uncharacterized protein n=1 Tax=Blattamonas nauphoetae TaxID=2049346 RepID=A0ABQ9Y4E3_9EUKA|nr:putative protein LTV1 [Blattamonas nauphoetae]